MTTTNTALETVLTPVAAPRKVRTSLARVNAVVTLRKGLDLSDRFVPGTRTRRTEYVPAGVRGRVIQVPNAESGAVQVEFPTLGLRVFVPRSLLKAVPAETGVYGRAPGRRMWF